MNIFTKFTEYIHYQVRNMNMSFIKISNSLIMEEVYKKIIVTMFAIIGCLVGLKEAISVHIFVEVLRFEARGITLKLDKNYLQK